MFDPMFDEQMFDKCSTHLRSMWNKCSINKSAINRSSRRLRAVRRTFLLKNVWSNVWSNVRRTNVRSFCGPCRTNVISRNVRSTKVRPVCERFEHLLDELFCWKCSIKCLIRIKHLTEHLFVSFILCTFLYTSYTLCTLSVQYVHFSCWNICSVESGPRNCGTILIEQTCSMNRSSIRLRALLVEHLFGYDWPANVSNKCSSNNHVRRSFVLYICARLKRYFAKCSAKSYVEQMFALPANVSNFCW